MSVREQNGMATISSPFEDTARLGQRNSWDASKGEVDADTLGMRTKSGGVTTSSAVATEPRGSAEIKSLAANAANDLPMRRGSSREASDAIRRFSSAGSQVVQMLTVVNRFQELVRLAGEAYIDPFNLTRVRTLGEGAFAKVVHCKLKREREADLDVAVKLLKPALFSSDLDVSDFVKEGIILKRLRHPSVVRVVGLGFKSADGGRGASPDSLFIVQELCAGGALRDVVAHQMFRPREVVYTYEDGLRWSIQIASALAHLHAQQPLIIHRDLKLDNVLLTGDCTQYDAKIADFGLHATVEQTDRSDSVKQLKRQLTKATEEERSRLADDSVVSRLDSTMLHMPASRPKIARVASQVRLSQHTHRSSQTASTGTTGRTVSTSGTSIMQRLRTLRKKSRPKHDLTGQTGSFLNMAPEVVLGKRYNETADLFSLAVVLYEIFTKTITAATVIVMGTPHECSDYAYKVAQGYRRPCPLSWPPELAQLIMDCWAQDSDLRPSAPQVVECLKAISESGVMAKMDAQEEEDIKQMKAGGFCCFGS